MLPDFLIVGAMKAGTTTLAYHLNQHPGVFLPDKEIHFFDTDKNYARGVQWYEDRFKQAGEGQIVGEKTPTYSYLPIVPQRIAKDLPNAKFLWIFRNPVDRTYSNYWHMVIGGSELLSFEEAIAKEPDRLKKSLWYGYRKRSVYVEQVERYLGYFSKSNMFFMFFEDLVDQTESEMRHVLGFLNIQESFHSHELEKKNSTFLPQSIYLQWIARKVFGTGIAFKLVKRLNRRRSKGYPRMDRAIRQELEEYFAPLNLELFNLIEKSTDKWGKFK